VLLWPDRGSCGLSDKVLSGMVAALGTGRHNKARIT
jgi:hypothetical protein